MTSPRFTALRRAFDIVRNVTCSHALSNAGTAGTHFLRIAFDEEAHLDNCLPTRIRRSIIRVFWANDDAIISGCGCGRF
jgi:hypothetical protein